MKIIHLSKADYNGAGICAVRICKAQRDMGLDSEMIVLSKRSNESFIHQYGKWRYTFSSLSRKIDKILNRDNDFNECRRLSKTHKGVYTLPISSVQLQNNKLLQEADIIHIHWVGGFLDYPSFFERYKDKAIVWTMHDENALFGIANIELQRLKDNKLEKKYYQLKYDALHKAKKQGFVFLSKMLTQLYSHHEMISGYKQTLIHNSVDYNLFQPHDMAEARKRLKLDESQTYVAFCACNINEERKGLQMLSNALMRIDPSIKILAIGKNRSKPRQTWENVIEMGRIDDSTKASWVLSAANLFCLPSLKENFAQVPLEAMSCGLPVVMLPCSGTEELITPSNGVRCEGFTLEDLENGLRKALATSYDSHAIREDMKTRFAPEKIAMQYLKFYQEVLNE